MDRDSLFLEVIDDLRAKTVSSTPYDILKSAGLIRQLILDMPTLVSIVKRGRIGKIHFKVKNLRPMPGVDAWFIGDGLDPDTSPPIGTIVTLSLDEFLKVIVLQENGNNITIKEVVRYVAHILGGVHAGTPQEKSDIILDELDKHWKLGNQGAPIYSLAAIARVVLKALEPLEAHIKALK